MLRKTVCAFLFVVAIFSTFVVVPETAAADFESRKQEIIARYEYAKPTYSGSVYDQQPSVKYPYSIGKVADGYLNDGLKMFNFVRFLAGLPSDVAISNELTDQAQHGAVLLAASGTLTHWPKKPSDMPTDFFDIGYSSTTSSNLAQANDTIAEVVYGWMKDNHDQLNLTTTGHRRWLLSPLLLKTGFGVAGDGYARYFAGQVFDSSRSGYEVPDHISWPGGAAFPNSFMDPKSQWSIQLNAAKYQQPGLNDVTVKLTCVSDNKTWDFSAQYNTYSESNRFFNVDNQGYGGWEVPYCVIFRPEGITKYSGEYKVSVSGLKLIDGSPTTLDYTVEFFDINIVTPTPPTPQPEPPITDGRGKDGGGGCSVTGLGLFVFALAMAFRKDGRW
ncbi:hypothetical protein AGMMS50276_24080 [Synergistales bacterium]|nr:hypothetical protein AGMMS50276_24080 [Synergistales bacterium]